MSFLSAIWGLVDVLEAQLRSNAMPSVTCNPSPLSKSDMELLNLPLEPLSQHHLLGLCQQNRKARLAMDFSTGWACISHASDVLGMCVMITSALLRTETERWRERYNVSRPAGSCRWVPWQAWHDSL